jgi:hypothetical protein
MHVVDLTTHEGIDPKPVLAGPWRSIRLARLAGGAREILPAGAVEYTAFVVDGSGTATVAGERVPLRPGTALTLVRGAGVELTADEDGELSVFLVAIDA